MTFASHRCWTVFVKKGVFLSAEAWRLQHGRAVRHAAIKDGGGEILQYNRTGMDPYPLVGWKKVVHEDGGAVMYEGPAGEVFESLTEIYEYEVASKYADADVNGAKVHLSILQQFLNECCSESEVRAEGEQRFVVTTSTLEDWLYRGDHPILACMSLQVYCMWVYRIEKPHRNPGQKQAPRFIDLEFAPHYTLRGTHLQRLATEFRVPLFEGYTMPSKDSDSETAAMFKQLVLRPLSVPCDDEPADVNLLKAFAPVCAPGDGGTAYTRSWQGFSAQQSKHAVVARLRFLDRYEWPSIWETEEVLGTLHDMYLEQAAKDAESGGEDAALQGSCGLDPDWCHDRAKPRATVEQYTALVGEEVAANLEGIARARTEKKPRQYQSDAAVHEAYIQATTGGGEPGEDAGEVEPATEPPKAVQTYFEPLPWSITSEEEMVRLLNFGHRVRLTAFAKELLALPCMQAGTSCDGSPPAETLERAAVWRDEYAQVATADESEVIDILELQATRLGANHDDAELDVSRPEGGEGLDPPPNIAAPPAAFGPQEVYRTPSAYVAALIAVLPSDQRLTRDQTLFMARFAEACDIAWEDEKKPAHERQTHHILILGQGGSGKTHVVQNLVFKVVDFLWPATSKAEPTLMVVASSSAQATRISTDRVKARTMHNASGMRVQKLANDRMRPGKKQASLTKLWDQVKVLVIEEVSMVAASWYNMLDVRSMHGRSKTHDVYETTYKRPQHHFGRIPIVIHLGDFLQLSPTANISLVEDVNAKNEDGSFKYLEPPSVEVQHAIKVFGSITHVFELRGTKRFKAGDPLIELLGCMRTGRKIPQRIWKAFERTFASDRSGTLDPRHNAPKFRRGFGMAMYWETLSRWISQRARRDARELGVPLVFLQAADECNTIDREAAQRLLNVPNMHNTGNIHGVFPSHVGMRVRFAVKVNSKLGLVQEQRATIVDFVFKDEDRLRYKACPPGELFRPKYLPAGIWLEVDDFRDSPIHGEVLPWLDDDCCCCCCHGVALKRARGLHLFAPVVAEFTWRSSDNHTVKRTGFALTHANYLTSTASQGQTIRTGVTIDCARNAPVGQTGMQDGAWWLHLYVMFSRATCMEDMLILRPPPRELLEAGPPHSVRRALERFDQRIAASTEAAAAIAARLGMQLPP